MFTTELIHFFQAFNHPAIHAFMVLISALGATPMVITIIIGITFGVDFKRGLVLINIVAWTAFFTVFAKEKINYPRPAQVDQSLHISQYDPIEEDFSSLLPTDFFEPFSEELLENTKTDIFDEHGLPSGHTSAQVALWIALVFLFRKRWMLFTGIIMIILTMISRMYLGSHFLGDVLAGALIGVICSFLLIGLVIKSNYMKETTHHVKSLSILWLPFVLLFFAPYTPHWLSGIIIGLNLASIISILKRNFPVFHIITWKRILATVISLSLFLVAFYINSNYQFSANPYLDTIFIALLNFIAISGALSINRRLHLIRFRY